MSRTRKRTTGAVGTVAALALACLGWAVWSAASAERDEGRAAGADGRTGTKEVPCREALRFADQERLPPGAEAAVCVLRHGIDTQYDIRFRISRTGLDAWLADTYPDMKLRSECVEDDVDHCGHLDLDPYAEGGAVAVELTARDESDGYALVHYRPFDT